MAAGSVAPRGGREAVGCLIDDFDEANELINWINFLFGLAEETAVDLPLLFIVSVTGRVQAGHEFPSVDNLTRELVGRGAAEWWHLAPLTREDVAAWIPLETAPGIVSQLHGVTGGMPRWVQTLWRTWRMDEAVVFNEHRQRWEWSADKKPEINQFKPVFEDLLQTLLHTDEPNQIQQAKEILGVAALEGATFTAEAVALVLDWETDELIDYLDENLTQDETRPQGIFREVGFVEIQLEKGRSRHVFRYSFAENWHWHVAAQYYIALSPEEKFKKSKEMIEALRLAYEPEERLAARSLARLCQESGSLEAARHYRTMAEFSMRREQMRDLVIALIQVETKDWDKFRLSHLAEFLIRAGYEMFGAYSYDETLKIADKAVELSVAAKDRLNQAEALCLSGFVLQNSYQSKKAQEKSLASKELFTQENNKSGLARSLNLLGQIALTTGEYAEAHKQASTALAIAIEFGDRRGQSASLYLLGKIATSSNELPLAEEMFAQALKILEEIGSSETDIVFNDLQRVREKLEKSSAPE